MKILIASDLYWPVINGVSTFSRNLAQGLAARGHEVAVIAPSQTGKKSKEIDGNYVIYRTKSTIFPFYQNTRICLSPQLEIRKIIQDFTPDVIHIQMILGIGQATLFFGRRYDIPVVTTSHAMAENLVENLKRAAAFSRPINYILGDYGRRFHSRADAITSPTALAVKALGKHAEKLTKPIEIISNGIDLTEYTVGEVNMDVVHRYSLPINKPIVTYIGRVDAEKHLWVMLEAIRRVRETTDVHALIVGSGVDLESLKHQARDCGIEEHVTFTGRVSDEDKIELERVGTVFFMPSPVELQSIATLEAMASGQPVVAVEAGALPELCQDERNGYLFPLDDAEAAASAIEKIVNDQKLRERFSQESIAIANTHDIQATLDQFTELYKRVIAEKEAEVASRPAGWRDRIMDNDFFEYIRDVREANREDDGELSTLSDDEIKRL